MLGLALFAIRFRGDPAAGASELCFARCRHSPRARGALAGLGESVPCTFIPPVKCDWETCVVPGDVGALFIVRWFEYALLYVLSNRTSRGSERSLRRPDLTPSLVGVR
eukprot:5193311-Prymnesium_polylepis.1